MLRPLCPKSSKPFFCKGQMSTKNRLRQNCRKWFNYSKPLCPDWYRPLRPAEPRWMNAHRFSFWDKKMEKDAHLCALALVIFCKKHWLKSKWTSTFESCVKPVWGVLSRSLCCQGYVIVPFLNRLFSRQKCDWCFISHFGVLKTLFAQRQNRYV